MNWSPARRYRFPPFGARVGWELALTHPEAVASLTLGGLPLHDHLITLRAMLEAHEGTSVTADSETPAADSTDEAIASFTSIIDNPIQPTTRCLKFVRIPFGPFFDVPALALAPRPACGPPGRASARTHCGRARRRGHHRRRRGGTLRHGARQQSA